MSTLYDVLGVAPDAEDEVIRQTFRELAKAYHPDVHGGEGPADQSFKRMTAAYAVLKHAKTRAAYDAKLALARRLARRHRIRGLLICVAGAVVSFCTVSSILLYRNSASAYATNDVKPSQAEILQAWRSVVPDRADVSAEPSASPNPQASSPVRIARAERQDIERQDSQPAGAAAKAAIRPSAEATAPPDPAPALVTGSLRHQPTTIVRDLALLPGTSTMPADPAPKIVTTDVRVWARSAEFGLNGSPRYVARIFKVRRELSDRPSVFGHADVLRRPAEGEDEYAGSCPSSVAAACRAATDRVAK